jgi:hypothetical protein
MADYPATFNIQKPEKFDRVQLALRVLVAIILAMIGGAIGWFFGLVYLILPVLAAIFISQKGAEKFIGEDSSRMTGWIRWVLAIYSYLALLTDRFPTEKPEEIVHYEITPGGEPTVGSALWRLIFSIPSAIVLTLLAIVGAFIWIIAAVMVLIKEDYPDGLYNFNLGVMRWEARLLAYHSSLVDPYPPFSLDTGQEGAGAAPTAPSAPPPSEPPAAEPPSAASGTE